MKAVAARETRLSTRQVIDMTESMVRWPQLMGHTRHQLTSCESRGSPAGAVAVLTLTLIAAVSLQPAEIPDRAADLSCTLKHADQFPGGSRG